jgi:hypothetical protein
MDINPVKGKKWHRYALTAHDCGGGSNRLMLEVETRSPTKGKVNPEGTVYVDSLQEARETAIGLIKGNKMGFVKGYSVSRVYIHKHSSFGGTHNYLLIPNETIFWAPIATARNEAEMEEKNRLARPYLASKWQKKGNKFVLFAHCKRG